MNKTSQHKRLLLLNGPNLNMLGRRDPTQYGNFTLIDVETAVREAAGKYGYELTAEQSNHEGTLVELIQQARESCDGILLNAGALTHYSYALRDAIADCGVPVMEIHISNIHKREPFRRISVIEPVCAAQISGLGFNSYLVALEQLCDLLAGRELPEKTSDLTELRIQLNDLDEALFDRFRERLAIVRQVADYKKRSGLPVVDLEREAVVAAQVSSRFPQADSRRAESLARTLMRLSREAQYEDLLPHDHEWALGERLHKAAVKPARAASIACQGASGAYSMEAGELLFPDAELVPAPTFAEACTRVLDGRSDLAVLPLENSTAGTVDAVYDLLLSQQLYIIQSVLLPIRHRLAAKPGTTLAEIRRVRSHPQALAQCQNFIRKHGWETAEAANTAVAAAEAAAAAEPGLAVIASAAAAELHGLEVLADDICDSGVNQTRFVVISRELVITPDADRVSLVLSTPHQSGALAATLSMFSDRGINLLKIQSRPDPLKAWNYRFYLDFESPRADSEAMLVLYQLEHEMPSLQLLGWYRELESTALTGTII
ncbi:MAG: type II 3-dehydroquinate dehydratase [Ruminococcaceae bacterium]|nr:type II 3-dehydroquinate dehydratase [Oscillospiraceae bacterium]